MRGLIAGKEQLTVGALVGKGGEGEVYSIRNRDGLAVKIYDPSLRSKREEKVRAMVAQGLAQQTGLVAYPGEIVSDQSGRFVGFLMRLVTGYRPVHELYGPKSRLRLFPKADYRFLVRAALNMSRAVGKVHQTGCVIGDLNHSGILVSQDATVALIDADSFQFNVGSKTYPCVVGVPDFTAPELHHVNLSSVNRTPEHDNFGLAVAIFHLLFMGRHPYAGVHSGPDISMGDAIAQNRFAFSIARRSSTQTTPPPGALTLEVFPPQISAALEQAFGIDPRMRPSATDWINHLTKFEGMLSRCGRVRTHYYPSHAGECVWCGLASKSGFDMFPDLSSVAPETAIDTQGTEQAIREIQAFKFPDVASLVPQSSSAKVPPSDALMRARSVQRNRTFLGILLIAGAGVAFFYQPAFWIAWIGSGIWGWAIFKDRSIDQSRFRDAFASADRQVQIELDAFMQRNGLGDIVKARGYLDVAIASYQSIDSDLARELAKLKSTREARQLAAYLDQFSVIHARIPGVGPAKTATLVSFGIETAADVTRWGVKRVPGFGDVMTGKLLDWRRKYERRFRYNPAANAQDVADEKALRSKFAAEKRRLTLLIKDGLKALKSGELKLSDLSSKARTDSALQRSLEVRARAESDLRQLGAQVPQSTVKLNVPQPTVTRPRTPPPQPSLVATPTVNPIISPNCPKCGASMRRRTGRYGPFWSCTRFPRCKGSRNI